MTERWSDLRAALSGQARSTRLLLGVAWREDRRNSLLACLETLTALASPLNALWLKLLVDGVTQSHSAKVALSVIALSAGIGLMTLGQRVGMLAGPSAHRW